MTGEISTGASLGPQAPVELEAVQTLDWCAIRRAEPDALRAAELEALEIVRALAVESLAHDVDAELDELDERRRHLARTAWPSLPLDGYRLQSSLGAFVVARVAVTWVPSGQIGLRRHPLERAAVVRALGQQGVDAVTAESLLGDWIGPPPGFRGTEDGLDPGALAGLAERSLTQEERNLALAQVAASGRDLARLATCVRLCRAVRRLLPVLASDGLGSDFVATLALLATGHPDRALALLSRQDSSLRARTVRELARTYLAFVKGEDMSLEPDGWAPRGPPMTPEEALSGSGEDTNPGVPVPEPHPASNFEVGLTEELGEGPPDLPEDPEDGLHPEAEAISPEDYDLAAALSVGAGIEARDGGTADLEEEVEEILEIVEESVDPESAIGRGWRQSTPPDLPAWWPEGPRAEAEWAAWTILAEHRRSGHALGLAEAFPADRGGPVPPDPRLVGSSALRDGPGAGSEAESPAEPYLPAVRGLLRAVIAATRGEIPSIERAGGLDWALRRAACLARGRQGHLQAAASAT
ncbi:MAG: hypothetical protein AAFU79_10120, partial [Myxococcota bacterium]